MLINDNVLQSSEKILFALRELYLAQGYTAYRMSKFEEYDFYAVNKDFLVSDNVITFTDIGGKLMALKPDVTLSIIKNGLDKPDITQKVYYNENVYRVSESSGEYKEIMQSGIECFGKIGDTEICEVLKLALQSLNILSGDCVLAISDLGILSEIVAKLGLTGENEAKLYNAISEKNFQSVDAICGTSQNKEAAERLKSLLNMCGQPQDVLPKLKEFVPQNCSLFSVMEMLSKTPLASMIKIDFSVVGDTNYYNGIIFKGFIKDIPVDVLSGGQYDRLMEKLGRSSRAIGFAVYTDLLDRLDFSDKPYEQESDNFINIALPKGRLGEKVYSMFASAGFECPSILEPNRKLIFENKEKRLRFFWVKPSDVAIYVEHGAADIGVAGKDILLEYEPDVYELLDLNKGKCRMAVAAPKGYRDDTSRTLRVATKFSNIAKKYYRSKGRNIDIIHLNGSIEIAPILGLSDVIVDIVETGTTLKENNLEVVETIVPISARLIANKSSYKFKEDGINRIKNGLLKVTEEEK